jgi:hypothetical protein
MLEISMPSQTQKATELKAMIGFFKEDKLQWKNWPAFPEEIGIIISYG